MHPKLIVLTLLSLLAFAGNSLLCRIALKQTAIDPTSFVAIRLLSGARVLWLVLWSRKRTREMEGTWLGACALFAYAITFSFAYSMIPAGTGALLLFASIIFLGEIVTPVLVVASIAIIAGGDEEEAGAGARPPVRVGG
ncbi:membrane protein [Skermanella stibiiresistens SB22]|uniref:Membrane protein n=2 Tax=Skermanella TaxID=204447 RepID=W9HCI5_9PROT|nr:membrane protein [Skermanella stibiiresistens SB22]